MHSVYHTIDGQRLHARVANGTLPGPDVVIVHGVVVSSRYAVPTARHLARRAPVHVPDLPAHGRSQGPPTALTVDERAQALRDWMDAAGIGKAHLIGNSAGCQIIAAFAQRHPARVDRIVMQGPTMDPAAPRFRQQATRWLVNMQREPRKPRKAIMKDYRDMGLRLAFQEIQATLADRIEERLPHVHAPTMVVRGQHDPIVPRRWAEEATALLPCATLREVPAAAHTMTYSSPLELGRIAAAFFGLPEVPRGAPSPSRVRSSATEAR